MKTIHKYPLRITDTQDVPMPFGARILTAQLQNGGLSLWALVENGNTPEPREVRIVGIGNPADVEGFDYIATVQMGGDWQLVWHVFAELAP